MHLHCRARSEARRTLPHTRKVGIVLFNCLDVGGCQLRAVLSDVAHFKNL